jgi:hypothetical protein
MTARTESGPAFAPPSETGRKGWGTRPTCVRFIAAKQHVTIKKKQIFDFTRNVQPRAFRSG